MFSQKNRKKFSQVNPSWSLPGYIQQFKFHFAPAPHHTQNSMRSAILGVSDFLGSEKSRNLANVYTQETTHGLIIMPFREVHPHVGFISWDSNVIHAWSKSGEGPRAAPFSPESKACRLNNFRFHPVKGRNYLGYTRIRPNNALDKAGIVSPEGVD